MRIIKIFIIVIVCIIAFNATLYYVVKYYNATKINYNISRNEFEAFIHKSDSINNDIICLLKKYDSIISSDKKEIKNNIILTNSILFRLDKCTKAYNEYLKKYDEKYLQSNNNLTLNE